MLFLISKLVLGFFRPKTLLGLSFGQLNLPKLDNHGFSAEATIINRHTSFYGNTKCKVNSINLQEFLRRFMISLTQYGRVRSNSKL